MDRQQNPNYQPRHSPPSYTPFSQPPLSSQIAPQQPSFDPFQRADPRRDPFMPSSLANRRGSQSGNGRVSTSNDVPQPSSAHPPSPMRPSPQSSFVNERRNSLESRYPGGASTESSQISQSSQQHGTSFLGRHMPPPSASPKHSPSQPYSSSNSIKAPLPPSSARPRDPPQRSSSMSIQSIMGSDSAPASGQQAWSSATTTTNAAHSASSNYHSATSPLDQRYGSKRDLDAEPAPHTPIRRPDGPAYAPFDRPITTLPSPSSATAKAYQPSDSQSFSRLLHPSTETNSVAPTRPYSQPTVGDANGMRTGPLPHDSRSPHDYTGGTFEKAVRDRSFSEQDRNREHSIDHIPRPPVEPFTPVSSGPNPIHAAYEPRPMDYRPSSPSGFRAASASSSSIPRQYQPTNGIPDPLHESGPRMRLAEPQTQPEPKFSDVARSRTPTTDSQIRKSMDESNRQSFPRFAHELGRRPDRSSPLPQAVQGAQGQPAGLARDPGVKSEFGRMFSGVGNGLRNTPQPVVSQTNGTGTPRRSPDEGLAAEADRPARRGGAAPGTRATGPGSRGGRRGKRLVVDETRPESDDGDGRMAPAAPPARGAKRGRYLSHQTGHHHHHHPPAPHHHHHHHARKPDDGAAFPLSRRSSGGPSNPIKFPTPGGTPGASTVPHHHHHHPHPNGVPHHHHHLHASTPEPRIKRPFVTVSTSPLLRSVSNLPRGHLGSQIYAPTVSVAPAASSTIDSPLSHQGFSEPNPLPRFDRSKSNSTFTIRVPRYYLSDVERERICKSRYLWGTDVYTDDSDPLAAAFHSGWIRGAWPADVDVSLLTELWDPESTGTKARDATKDKGSSETLTAPPTNGPLPPPPNKDLHLTILMLPPLDKYTGITRYGVKSRTWGDNHDGLSFKIDKVEWVDEGMGSRWQERGAEARRKRITEAIASSRINVSLQQAKLSHGVREQSHTSRNPAKRKAVAITAS